MRAPMLPRGCPVSRRSARTHALASRRTRSLRTRIAPAPATITSPMAAAPVFLALVLPASATATPSRRSSDMPIAWAIRIVKIVQPALAPLAPRRL